MIVSRNFYSYKHNFKLVWMRNNYNCTNNAPRHNYQKTRPSMVSDAGELSILPRHHCLFIVFIYLSLFLFILSYLSTTFLCGWDSYPFCRNKLREMLLVSSLYPLALMQPSPIFQDDTSSRSESYDLHFFSSS